MGENFQTYKRLADSKLKTKKFLTSHKVAVPATLAIIKRHQDLNEDILKNLPLPYVIKPNNGYGGKGILIIEEKTQSGAYVNNT